MPSLNNAKFWDDADKQLGALQQDRGMKYMMLEGSYKMLPVLRNVDKTFSDFLLADAGAKKCKIVINGNFWDLGRYGLGEGACPQHHRPERRGSSGPGRCGREGRRR